VLITATIASGNLVETKKILEEAADFEYVNRVNESGSAPLHIAANHGYLDIVEYLLEQGASVHQLDANQQTPVTL
jgi:ankyrin repeat protein